MNYGTLQNIMDEKTLQVLEFPKVLEQLAGFTSFSASTELARSAQTLHHMTKLP